MDKVSKHTEEQALDAKISEKRVTKRYLRKKFKHSLKRTKRRDTHHRRKKLVEEDSDLGSSNKDMKLAKLIRRPLLASAVVAVSMKRQKESKILEIEEIEAVACAIQNMHLSCTAYGLGGFWSTPKLMYSSEMNDFLELDEIDKCLGLFYIGYPSIDWPTAHRKPLEFNTKWIKK